MTGALPLEAGRPVSCRECGWTGTVRAHGQSDPGVDAGDPAAPACPRCGAIAAPDLPSADEIRAARQTPEA